MVRLLYNFDKSFYQISPNPLIAYRHAYQRLIASSEYIHKIMNRADDVKDLLD